MTDTRDPLRDHLHQMIAAVAQREYEDSITTSGTVAHAEHLGSRIAAGVMALFPEVELIQEGRYADGSHPQRAYEFPNYIDPTHTRYELRTAPASINRCGKCDSPLSRCPYCGGRAQCGEAVCMDCAERNAARNAVTP